MKDKVMMQLKRRAINNVGWKDYPSIGPSINTLDLHVEIYRLIDEYVGLKEDWEKVGAGSRCRGFIERRATEIENELLSRFWIVEGDQMVDSGREKRR